MTRIAHITTSFDASKFGLASNGYVLPWVAGIGYNAGQQVVVAGAAYFRKTTGVSAASWLLDQINWIQGPISTVSLSPAAPAYFSAPRGQFSIKHAGTKQQTRMLKESQCLEASVKLPYDYVINVATGMNTADLIPGMCLRVRSDRVPGGVQEVIGIINEMSISIEGAKATGYVNVSLGLVPGNGLARWAAGTTTLQTVFPGAYAFGNPSVPVNVASLVNPGYVVLEAKTTGPSWASVRIDIAAAVAASTDKNALKQAISTICEAAKMTFACHLRPLTQEPVLSLQHPAMTAKLFAAPKNIVLA